MPSKAAVVCAGALTALVVALSAPSVSQAATITINPVFDSSITGNANATAIKAGINAAISEIESGVATAAPLSVSITFSNATTGLGGSSQSLYSISYSSYRARLAERATSANDATALSNLPNTATFNGFSNMALTAPHLRALGYTTPADDASISINTSITNLSRTGSQNSNYYDLETVALHEIDEVLGVGGPATSVGAGYQNSYLGSLDPFRYKGLGAISHATGDTAYLSINNGVTNIITYNNAGAGSDYADYASNATHYVQDAYGTPGTYRDLAAPELVSYDVIGYTLIPEPAALALLGLGAGALLRRHRSRMPLG